MLELHGEVISQEYGEGSWPEAKQTQKADLQSHNSPGLQHIWVPTVHHVSPQMVLALNHQDFF